MKQSFKIIVVWGACLLFATIDIMAQTAFLDANEQIDKLQNVELGGKASVVFISNEDNIVLTSSMKSDPQSPSAVKKDGKYHYEIVFDVSSRRDRVFTAAKRGTALKVESKRVFRPNQRVFYVISEVENPIMLENQSSGSDAYLVNGKACVEFTSSVDDIRVDFSPALNGKLTRTKTASGANLISLEIDIATLAKLREAVEQARKELEAFEEKIDNSSEKFTTEMANREKELEESFQESEGRLVEAMTISVYAKGTNVLVVPMDVMEGLSAKQKVPFGVIPLNQEGTTITRTSYDQFMLNGNQSFEIRRYDEAAKAYQEAAEAVDATSSQRELARVKVENMKTFSAFKKEAYKQVSALNSFKKRGDEVDYNIVEECYNMAIQNFVSLREQTNDHYYDDIINKLRDGKEKLGVVLIGTVVHSKFANGVMEEKDIKAGEVFIYGVSHYDEKKMKKGPHGDKLGTVGEKGVFRLQIPKDKYTGLLFVPAEKSVIGSNVYKPLEGNKHLRMRIGIH